MEGAGDEALRFLVSFFSLLIQLLRDIFGTFVGILRDGFKERKGWK